MVAMIADPVTVVRVMAAALVEVSPHVVAYASYPVSFSQWSSLRGETSRLMVHSHSLLNEEIDEAVSMSLGDSPMTVVKRGVHLHASW